MSRWQDVFVHRPEFGIIVCQKCEYAVVPKQVERHIKDHHPFTTKAQRAVITQSIEGLPDIAHRFEDIIYPKEDEPPVAGLPVYDGLQCRECGYVCRKIFNMQEHCKRQHRWKNNQTRGGQSGKKEKHSRNRIWNVDVQCQRFFEYRQWQRLFAVRVSKPTTPANKQAIIDRAKSVKNSVKVARAAHQDERRIQGSTQRWVANPWLDFVGWHRHLAGVQVKELMKSIWPAKGEAEFDESIHESQEGAYPEGSEAALARACKATKRMIRRAFATSTVERVGRAALEAVNRRECGLQDNEKPFYGKLKVQSLRKYMQVWVKMLRYIWRTAGQESMPRYRLTDTQATALQRLFAACEKTGEESPHAAVQRQEAAEKASTVFWVSMFDHELQDDEFDSGIVSALAVLGLNDNGEWRAALNYTQVLSAVITSMRAVVVYRAWLARQQAVQRAIDDGEDEEEAKRNAPSVVRGADALTRRFMTMREFGGTISPMDRLYHQRTFGMKIRFTTKAEGRATWQGEQLCIDNISFSMNDVRSVVHGLVDSVQRELVRELLILQPDRGNDWKPDALPRIRMEKLFDNPAELTAGWSWLQDARTEWAVSGGDWMVDRMFAERAVEKRFVKHYSEEVRGFDDVQWDDRGIERYFRAVRRWKEQLIVLVHLSAGAPARATELLSIQHKNGAEAKAQRGIFIENQMMAFVTMYHKGYSTSGKFKAIHRFVPDEVAELVAYYLWLVQPFVEHLQFVSKQCTDEPSSFLWEPEPEEEWEAGEDEELEDELNEVEPNTDEGDEGGHVPSKPQAVSGNVDGFWDTNRMRRVMQRETERRIGVKIGVALWRQAYPAIQRQYSVDANVRETIDQLYDMAIGKTSGETSIEEIRAKQAGHGWHIEEMIYGLLINESPFTTMHEREQFRRVSMDWHRMLHFQSAWREDGRMPKQVKQQLEAARQEARHGRYRQMRSVDIDAQLQRITQNEKAAFRGVQREGLQAIVGGMPRVTIVMRTGGGKSLFFMIPAAGSKDGVTIVVVPVVSLRQDLVDRCEKVGMSVAAWDGSRPPYHARIIFVTAESAVTLAFGRFVDEKRASFQLERIVIDECHSVLEASHEWRPRMLRLHEMAQKDVQVVYLTATLPPSEEEAWLSVVGVARKDMHIIRDVTTRPNIAYSVVPYDVKEEETRVKALVEEKLAQYPDGQVIVYCRTIEQVRKVAEYTGGQAYYRAIGTSEEKARILRRLTDQSARLFVATNALGLGVDAPRIRCVVHVGCPSEIKQYAQESGRAGRDGVGSEAMIMRGMKRDRGGEKPANEWGIAPSMARFLEGKECRRAVYDRQMDGRRDRLGCEDGEEWCDVCVGRGRVRKRREVARAGREYGEERQPVKEVPMRVEARSDVGLGLVEVWDGRTVIEREEVGGEEKEEEEEEWEREYREMDALAAQTNAIQQRARMQVVRRHLQAEQFDALMQQWQGRCSICVAGGYSEEGHDKWRHCPRVDERAAVERRWLGLKRVRYKYSACYRCHAPQAICQSWEAIGGAKAGRFRRVGGAMVCQFEGVVQDAAAAIWATGEERGVGEWLGQQMQRAMMDASRDKENGGMECALDWFGRKFVEGGIEVSGLCRMVWEFGQLGG